MKIKYFGTGAAEGVPALFCHCRVCKQSRKNGGRDLRTRSQAIVDNQILIDFPGDSYFHFIQYNYDLMNICHLLVTHGHADHFYAEDLMMRMQGYSNGLTNRLTVYGNDRVGEFYKRAINLEGFQDEKHLTFSLIRPFEPFHIKKYKVTPLLADHDKKEKCLFYQIDLADKTLLYGHDTGIFLEENWEYWKNTTPVFDFVSLDCTHQNIPVERNHMSIHDNIYIKNRMLEMGFANSQTIFVLNHFSHNGGMLYDEFNRLANKYGFIVAYDGLEISF